MKSLFSKSIFKLVLMLVAFSIVFFIGKSNASIPANYLANYEIKTDYDKIL